MNTIAIAKSKAANLRLKVAGFIQTGKAKAVGAAGLTTFLTFCCQPAMAADVTALLTMVIRIMAILITVLGLFLFITGLISWSSAHADGDGPAQNKAVGKFSAGAMLIILSIILNVNASNLVGYIDTSL